MESEKLVFNSTNPKFSNSNFTRSNNTTPTSSQVKKESNFTLKYAALATPTQQHRYKQGCGIGVPESHVLERSRNTFFKFDKVGVASRSLFFRFGGIESRRSYCFWRLRLKLNYFTFLHFISIFILLTRKKATEAL